MLTQFSGKLNIEPVGVLSYTHIVSHPINQLCLRYTSFPQNLFYIYILYSIRLLLLYIVTNHLFLSLIFLVTWSLPGVSLRVIYVVLRKSSIMAYDIKNVFYLGFEHQYDNGAWTAKDSVQPLDVSAYVDPISKGRTRGQGLAVYRVSHHLTASGGGPILPTETSWMTMALSVKPYTTTGDLISVVADGDLLPSNDLLIQGDQFMGEGTGGPGGHNNLVLEYLAPTKEVPYVVVRDTIFCVMSNGKAIAADIKTGYRLECAMISLDTATLNQLLRTQTA
jgi:hypothetical protein